MARVRPGNAPEADGNGTDLLINGPEIVGRVRYDVGPDQRDW